MRASFSLSDISITSDELQHVVDFQRDGFLIQFQLHLLRKRPHGWQALRGVLPTMSVPSSLRSKWSSHF
jgi:hypothetical protein